jgi:hypothetical protein
MTFWMTVGVIACALAGTVLVIVWLISGLNDQERVGR